MDHNIRFTAAGTDQYSEHLKFQKAYDYIQKPEIILVEDRGEIKAGFNNWDSNGYNYSLNEISLLLDMISKTKDTMHVLATQKENQNGEQRLSSENSSESGPDLRISSQML